VTPRMRVWSINGKGEERIGVFGLARGEALEKKGDCVGMEKGCIEEIHSCPWSMHAS